VRTGGHGSDSRIALATAARAWRMNIEQQIPGLSGIPCHFLNGPEGVAVAKEHGELGVLQNFVPGEGAVLIGGGRARSFTDAVSREPNSVGLSAVSSQLLASQQILGSRI